MRNTNNIIDVYWSRLLPLRENVYRRECPFCDDGVLLVGRDQETLELQEFDRCISCGQIVRYIDIEAMREQERPR